VEEALMLTLVAVEGIVIVLFAVLVVGLLRSHAEILRTLDRLGADEHGDRPTATTPGLPGFGATRRRAEPVAVDALTGVQPDGTSRTIALTGSRGYVLAAFLSSGCSTCKTFWKSFDRDLDLPHPAIRPVLITKGHDEESVSDVATLAPRKLPTLMSSEMWDAFRVPGTPYFQLIDTTDGRVLGEGSASNWGRLGDLITRSIGDAGPGSPLRRSTSERMADSDEALRRAGIEPGDGSLHRTPTDGVE